MKIKIGFTVTTETLIGLMAKMLPDTIENLTFEEVPDGAWSPVPYTKPTVGPKLAKPRRPTRKASKPFDPRTGINGIILTAMADGKPHRAIDLKPLLKAAGFSENSTGSRLQALREKGVVTQLGDGNWQLKGPSQ